jgi:hypothetical protein
MDPNIPGTGIFEAAAIATLFDVTGKWLIQAPKKLRELLAFNGTNLTPDDLRFLSSTSQRLAVLPGEGNQWKLSNGVIGASAYISQATTTFLESLAVKENICKVDAGGDNIDEIYRAIHNAIQIDQDLLVLGGPVANIVTRRCLGYQEVEVCEYDDNGNHKLNPDGTYKKKILPVFDPDSGFPFGFFCGLGDYGWYPKGELVMPAVEKFSSTLGMEYKEISRYREDGKFEGPHTGIVWSDGRIEKLRHYNGVITEEVLLIARVPHPKPSYPHRTMTVLGGAHGYTVREFGKNWKHNLKKLKSLAGNSEYFMAMIWAKFNEKDPCNVDLLWESRLKRRSIIIERINYDKYREWVQRHAV